MTPFILLRQTAERFRKAGIPDPETDSSLLLSYLCCRPALSLRLDTDTVLSAELMESFFALAERRIAREPLQYILNEAPFCGRMFYVDSRVLIPRPETELLCRWALELSLSGGKRILDLCCGSGCIGLTISAERPDLSVMLSDISAEALEVTSLNAKKFGLNVVLHKGNLTAGLPDNSFDLILSNPPYIPSAECSNLQPEVMKEPSSALDGGADGLDFYRKIIADSPRVLKPHGLLLMELGSGESEFVLGILKQYGFFSVEVRKDFSGIERMILAQLHSEVP